MSSRPRQTISAEKDGSSMPRGAVAPDLPATNGGRDEFGAGRAATNTAADGLGPAINGLTKIVTIKMPHGVGPDHTANKAANGPGPARDFTKIVAIHVQGKTFYVHKDILTTQPDRFDAEFKNPSLDQKAQSISIDKVSSGWVAEYIQALQHSVYVPDFKLQPDQSTHAYRVVYPLTKLLVFQELALRFFDKRFQSLVVQALDSRWKAMSVEGWREFYLCQSDGAYEEEKGDREPVGEDVGQETKVNEEDRINLRL